MNLAQVMAELKANGAPQTKKIYAAHGAPFEQWGVKIEALKKIQKQIKKDYLLSLELYDSGIADAQYLAGLIADESKMTKSNLQHWAETASWYLISEYTVAWITAESGHGWELALEWIDRESEALQASGWSALASLVAIRPDEALDLHALHILLQRVASHTHNAPNRAKYNMNAFLIAVGGYVASLRDEALEVAARIGKVQVDMGGTACKVPSAPEYIQKMLNRGVKKKKMARC